MKNILFICVILFTPLIVKAQSVDSLKYELSYYKSEEKYGDKIAMARILQEKVPFDRQAVDYICRYYYDRGIDSVSVFLNKLISDYPDSTKAYILKAEHITFIKDIDHEQEKAKCLRQGYFVDSLDLEINYMLAELYYNDFLKPYYKPSWGIGVKDDDGNDFFTNRVKQKPVFNNPTDKALFYLYNLEKINPNLKKVVYIPIQQIEKSKNKNWVAEDINSIDDNCYFPIWYFLNLSENWMEDLSKDYLFELQMSPSAGLTHFLQKINEPCLYQNNKIEAQRIFRFTWLRSFHNPVCLRLEDNRGKYTLYWKLLDGAGGYDYGKLTTLKSKTLSENEWSKFLSLFEKANFEDLPNRVYYPMTDGASWTLEYKTLESFKAHDTNVPSEAIKECCTYLLGLTNLKIKEEDIY